MMDGDRGCVVTDMEPYVRARNFFKNHKGKTISKKTLSIIIILWAIVVFILKNQSKERMEIQLEYTLAK